MVVGVSTVKDEVDVAPFTVDWMLGQVDHVIVADNQSTDGTREWLDGRDEPRLTVVDDPEFAYFHGRKMTGLARMAADMGADWVVPFDADEFWVAAGGTLKDALEGLAPGLAVVVAPMLNHVCTPDDDPAIANPAHRMPWRLNEPGALVKSACRPAVQVTISDGSHDAAYSYGREREEALLAVHHFGYRSAEQATRKARKMRAGYAATSDEHLAVVGNHWRKYGEYTDEQVADEFRDWWLFDPADERLVWDGAEAW